MGGMHLSLADSAACAAFMQDTANEPEWGRLSFYEDGGRLVQH